MKGCTFCKYTSASPKKELKHQDFLIQKILGFRHLNSVIQLISLAAIQIILLILVYIMVDFLNSIFSFFTEAGILPFT